MAALAPVPSHPTPASPLQLSPGDDAMVYPQLTERGPHTTEYETESPTGVVEGSALASSGLPLTASSSSSRTHVDGDARAPGEAEKGDADVKLVTWLENDPENPRNLTFWSKWKATLLASSLCFNAGQSVASFRPRPLTGPR